MATTSVEIIIISFNCMELTAGCISSIYSTCNYPNLSITVVDNNSQDGTVEFLKKHYPEIKLIVNSENLGYAKAINIGVANSESDIVILSNADVVLMNQTIEMLVSELSKNNSIGATAPQQIYPDGSWQYSWGYLPGVYSGFLHFTFLVSVFTLLRKTLFNFNILAKFNKSVPYLDGAFVAVKRSSFNKAGGFDEDYYFYSEEADFCYKLGQMNLKCVVVPKAVLIHLRGGSSTNNIPSEKFINLLNKGKVLFCLKRRSKFATLFFIYSQIFHNFVLYIIISALANLLPKYQHKKETVRMMYSNFLYWLKVVKKYKYDKEVIKNI